MLNNFFKISFLYRKSSLLQILPREFYQTLSAQKMKFFMKNFLCNCEQIEIQKTLTKNFILCALSTAQLFSKTPIMADYILLHKIHKVSRSYVPSIFR